MKREKQTAPRSARAAGEKLLRALVEIRRSIIAGVRAVAIAKVERINGFRGRSSATQYESNTIDLADQELDRLALEREELEQAQGQQQPARVAA